MSDTPALSKLNYVNLAAYIFNVIFTYGIGVAGIGGLPNNSDLSLKYQTLVTPIGWAFSIWGPIFISQAIFTVAQLLPKYRSSPLVTEGVGYWYALVCLAQSIWTISFSLEVNWLAFIFMFTILGFLAQLNKSQYNIEAPTNGQWWLFKFPFQLHIGWIIAASFVNFSVLLVAYGSDDNMSHQISVAICSLGCVWAIALYVLFVLTKPLVTVGGVAAWALGGIAAQLASPMQTTIDDFATFGEEINTIVLDGVGGGAAILSVFFAVVVVLEIANIVYKQCADKNVEGEQMRKFSAPLTGTGKGVDAV